MRPNTDGIQKISMAIQKASTNGNKLGLDKALDEMIDLCINLKSQLEEKKKISEDISLKNINLVPFIYKPIIKKNYYEGSYLEEFSHTRTAELKDAKALDTHNKFWINHEIMRGNIFGSLPKELVNKDSVSRLLRYGWDEVIVEVFEVIDRKCTMKELVDFCEINYKNFLMVKEKSTGAELILHYKV